MQISQQLRDWANLKRNQASPRSAESILKERADEDFDPDSMHVAICGPAGSGKSSLVNALRGLSDDDENAARTGVDETTQERGKYLAHSSFYPIVLYDFPGAGTIQHPCMGYYELNKLYLYSLLLITYGERLGEAEISIIKECVQQNQPFILVRSRSDELINRLNGRRNDKRDEARHELIQSTVKTFKSQLGLLGGPSKVIEELMTYCLIVNRDDLPLLAKTPKSEWPRESSTGEMQERQLLTLLGKRVGDEAATSR
ncbi:P-loop containing nucleoside triphosphate hydrolase protein [Trichoderma pleuroticola]